MFLTTFWFFAPHYCPTTRADLTHSRAFPRASAANTNNATVREIWRLQVVGHRTNMLWSSRERMKMFIKLIITFSASTGVVFEADIAAALTNMLHFKPIELNRQASGQWPYLLGSSFSFLLSPFRLRDLLSPSNRFQVSFESFAWMMINHRQYTTNINPHQQHT